MAEFRRLSYSLIKYRCLIGLCPLFSKTAQTQNLTPCLCRYKLQRRIPSRYVHTRSLVLSQYMKSQPSRDDTEIDIVSEEEKESRLETVQELVDNEEDDSALLEFYVNKAQNEMDYMDDVDYHDIENVNKRLFFKIVDVWLKDVGSAKRGHRDFVQTLLNSLSRFDVECDISAYVKLLDCFPDGKHTGLKRDHWYWSGFADKISDHLLGQQLMFVINEHGAIPNDQLFNKTTDLFGRFSPVTLKARSLLFWYPRMVAHSPHPISIADFKKLTPTELAFNGLRQINPGVDCHYHNFAVDKSRCKEVIDSDKIDSIISCQSEKQKEQLAQHDLSIPVYIEGPFVVYYRLKKVQYYVMRANPSQAKVEEPQNQRTTIVSDKEWWSQFYGVDYQTSKPYCGKTLQFYPEEDFFPTVDIVDGYGDKKSEEISLIDSDTQSAEGPVYAIACTDYSSPVALQSWVRGLILDNPVLREASVVFREEQSFMLNAPKDDPNESDYENIDIRDI
ncbi:evolutionarily conserved signaling intermediate in Toll pathway, mitochondrial-like [Clavelina lepadiformis]|uniref:evolutionarily conserved signaling intermediate in Toll pathway, mitochondrial-like n=1 Tax=Clavelina lepadiformis TaxID=159417 RepID=UPI00404391A2